jgi:hypothetical protein
LINHAQGNAVCRGTIDALLSALLILQKGVVETIHSWKALDPIRLRRDGPITARFLHIGKQDLRSAGQYIQCLPYARNTRPDNPLIVLQEERGTCSTKHACIRRLAIEQDLDIALLVGIYQMTEQNTPGVGEVLGKYGLAFLPEAHCYLLVEGKRIDLTRAIARRAANPILVFLHEEEIEPAQITSYKIALHKQFLSQWVTDSSRAGRWSLEEIWKIREECIASLSS